ncbi:hypothetical protein K439DRAFT_687691 [Ramaria rubella]|nr:hypothetical protein K439DRAFT_687691 [Ramaria rubella]
MLPSARIMVNPLHTLVSLSLTHQFTMNFFDPVDRQLSPGYNLDATMLPSRLSQAFPMPMSPPERRHLVPPLGYPTETELFQSYPVINSRHDQQPHPYWAKWDSMEPRMPRNAQLIPGFREDVAVQDRMLQHVSLNNPNPLPYSRPKLESYTFMYDDETFDLEKECARYSAKMEKVEKWRREVFKAVSQHTLRRSSSRPRHYSALPPDYHHNQISPALQQDTGGRELDTGWDDYHVGRKTSRRSKGPLRHHRAPYPSYSRAYSDPFMVENIPPIPPEPVQFLYKEDVERMWCPRCGGIHAMGTKCVHGRPNVVIFS